MTCRMIALRPQLRDISLRELLRWHGFEIRPEGITVCGLGMGVAGDRCYRESLVHNKAGVGGGGADIRLSNAF